MLAAMTHDQFDEWCAKDIIEPIGSMQPVCEILAKIGGLIAAFVGHELKEEHFMPWIKPPKIEKKLTPRQSAAALQSHLRMLASQ